MTNIQNIVLFTDSFPPLEDATSSLNASICKHLSEKSIVTVVYPWSRLLNPNNVVSDS